jgi:formylglycine-generating enzyme required for sulfatase activity
VVGIAVKREALRPPLTLWLGTSYENWGTLGLSDGQGVLVTGNLKLSSFQGREAPLQHLGRYTVAFQAAGSPPAAGLPEGYGYLVMTIANSGYARWTGQLADGIKLSGSALVCGNPTSDDTQFIPVYALSYQGMGSLRGWLSLDAAGEVVGDIQARGALDWMKQPVPVSSRDRAYRTGIPFHTLDVQGGRYVAPVRSEAVFRLFDERNNARVILSGGGLTSPIVRGLTLTSADSGAGGKRRVELAPVWEGMAGMSLQVDAVAGTFSGELRWTDFDPTAPLKDVVRLTRMQGVLLPNQEMAAGHFMLPQLPMLGPPLTTLANSPLVSGRVELKASNGTLSPEFVLLPSGDFQLGDSLNEGNSDELPLRWVTLNQFAVQNKEVTLQQWREVMSWALNNGYDFENLGSGRGVNHPVQGINWYDAVKWCNARSEMERREPCYYTAAPFNADRVYRSGRVDLNNSQFYLSNGPHYTGNGYRLPTEAEWERAARGGVRGGRFPTGPSISHATANYVAAPEALNLAGIDASLSSGFHPVFGARGVPLTAPVGSFAGNFVGIYDMSGNVAEWCWDWYAPYAPGLATNPRGGDKPVTDARRVLRGGSGQSGAMQIRHAARDAATPDAALPYAGFRVVRRQF